MRSTPSRARLLSIWRRIRSGARPVSPGVPVVEWNTLVVRRSPSGARSARHSPIQDSLAPPPYASPVSNQWMPFSHARSMIANASSWEMPRPKNSGAEPTPPKFPHPSSGLPKLTVAPSCSSFGQVHPGQLVPDVPELGVERVVDQATHDLDGCALGPDHVGADHTLDDLEVPDAPDDHALVELDQAFREDVEILELAAARIHLDEREPCALVRGVEGLAERLCDAADLLEPGRVEPAAVTQHLAHLGVLPRRHVLEHVEC